MAKIAGLGPVYGFLLDSEPALDIPRAHADRDLTRLTLSPATATAKLAELCYEQAFLQFQGRQTALLSNLPIAALSDAHCWGFRVKDVVTYHWSSAKQRINYVPHQGFTVDLLQYWLLHTVLPLYCTLQGRYYVLHGGAVEVEGQPVVFTGPSHGGKSTLTEYFLKRGHALISDDRIATLERAGDICVVPSHPFHRPYRKAEELGYRADSYAQQEYCLSCVYELEQVDADEDIELTEIHGVEKFKSLRFSSEFNFPFLKQQRFKYLARMADRVAVYKIRVPQDLAKLPQVYERIVSHCSDEGSGR